MRVCIRHVSSRAAPARAARVWSADSGGYQVRTVMNQKVDWSHWESAWATPPRMRLPSPWFVGTRDRMRLLRAYVHPGMRFLEIGCAPGKLLSYVAKILRAEVAGIDYSERGIQWARQLFDALHIRGDLRCEDVFATTFTRGTFDVVHSAGVIEHFDDPRDIVRIHMEMLKPGGIALITVPNFSGLYRKLAQICDSESLLIHNLDIMDCESLMRLPPPELVSEVHSWFAGRVCLSAVNIDNKLPRPIASAIQNIANCIGLLQPFDVRFFCPQIVLLARSR
jgi:2-polyprenyl-3-methyl-5-hydroxy-6-metoxy-1,4-benzoquinol methylase